MQNAGEYGLSNYWCRFRRFFSLLLLLSLLIISLPAAAVTCGQNYVVQLGNSLSRIANNAYGDTQKWTVIYNVNLDIIGPNPNVIEIGQSLSVPCLGEVASRSEFEQSATQAAMTDNSVSNTVESTPEGGGQPQSDAVEVIRFLTANDYAPFTDQSLPDGGMVTDIVVTAMSSNSAQSQFGINWVDDWSLHLNELLASYEYDMGFPWLRPDCDATPDEFRCVNYEFSSPVFEMLILLFTHKDRPLSFNNDEDIKGKVLCRPNGYYTHDLEKDGRLWLTNDVIELKQPDTINACFDMLSDGSVDAVALNEFTGRSAIADLKLQDEVVALENKPLSVEGLHVVIHKDHPRSRELMRVFNDSLTALQLSDNYRQIVAKHFRNYWNTIE